MKRNMTRIRVQTEGGKGYDILVGCNTLEDLGPAIKRLGLGDSIFLITSPRIAKFHLKAVRKGLRGSGCRNISVHYVPDGERYKDKSSYDRLLNELLSFGRGDEKKVFVVNLGGGVVGDLGGFVAATYKRGINYVQIPSTLLALVDCGIGGKVGINFNGAKNIIGAFHQPALVYADFSLLKTLSKRELRSGLAEVVKYGVIESPGLFDFVERNTDKIFALDNAVIRRIVTESYSIKADIVERDEFDEKGIRARLNFGHTIGHAIESASRYAYRHGESVAIGMVCANDIAVALGRLTHGDAARVENLLVKIGLPVRMKNHNLQEILKFFWRDKKFVGGKNRFILASQIGKTSIVDGVPMGIIKRAIRNRFTSTR